MSNVELIKKIIEENNGILLSRELRKKNIHLQYINQLEKSGYIENKYYMIGIEIKELQDGTKIRIYNKERTICDIIKSRNKMDPQILNMAVKEYFSQKDSNYILLMKYAKIFRIEKIIRYYSEVL